MANGNTSDAQDAKPESNTTQIPNEGSSNEVEILKARIAELEREKKQAEREIDARMKSVDQACIVSETGAALSNTTSKVWGGR